MKLVTDHSDDLVHFVQDVQQRTGLDYRQAHQLARSTLKTLGETISAQQARQLARWLPLELAQRLAIQTGDSTRVSPNAFLEKIGGQITVSDHDGLTGQIRGTLQAVRDTAPAGALDDTIARLPKQLAALFEDH